MPDNKPVIYNKKSLTGFDINKLLDLENERIEVDKLREKNISKELDYSRASSKDATIIAKKDLENQKFFIERSFEFRKRIINYFFFILIFIILIVTVIIFYFRETNLGIINKILVYGGDIIKITMGGLLGYFYKSSRINNNIK